MHDESNPYAPPSSEIGRPRPGPEVFDLRLFLRWERLRLAYNGVLALETALLLVLLPPRRSTIAGLPFTMAACCFMANVCFCLGPVLDGYARWIGWNHRLMTNGLFVSGLLLACFVALLVILFLHFAAVGGLDGRGP